MEQNPCPVVREVTKPTGTGLDELNGAIEAFGTGVADSMLAEVQQPFFVAPEHLDDLFDCCYSIVRQGLEEAFGSTLVAVAPELAEVLLDAPRPAGFQVEMVQSAKRDGFGAAPIRILFQPSPLAARQW